MRLILLKHLNTTKSKYSFLLELIRWRLLGFGPGPFFLYFSWEKGLFCERTDTMCRVMLWQRWVLLLLVRGLLEIPQGESSQCFHCHDCRKWEDGVCREVASGTNKAQLSLRLLLSKTNVIPRCYVMSRRWEQMWFCSPFRGFSLMLPTAAAGLWEHPSSTNPPYPKKLKGWHCVSSAVIF